MKFLVLLCALSAVKGAHIVPVAPVTTSYHAQNELGEYAFGYSGGPSAKEEIRTADGVTRGGYSYIDAHGLVQSAAYVSDAHNGFRVAATNLPVGPAVPTGHVLSTVHAPALHLIGKRSIALPLAYAGWHAPLAAHYGGYDTPEVTSAKIAHAQYHTAQRAAVATEAAANGHGLWGIHGHLIGKRSIAAVPLAYAGWHAPLAAHYGGYDTPAVTSAKIAHAQYHTAQRAAVATEAAANGHGLWGIHGHLIGKRSIAAVPLAYAGWHAPLAAHYGGYDTPAVTSAKIAHAQYHTAQRAAVATEAAANGHGIWGIHGHLIGKRSIAALPLAYAGWHAPLAAHYGGYDTPEVTSAKIAHAQYHTAQRAAVATEAAANHGIGLVGHGLVGHGLVGHGLVGHGLVGHLLKKRSIAAVPLAYAGWHAPLAAHYGGYDTPEVTSAKIAHAQYHTAQRAAVATEAAANGYGAWGLLGHGHAHLIGKRSIVAAVPLAYAGWHAPLAAHYGGYDTPEVTSAKIAHAHAQVAQRAALASEAASHGHGLWGLHGHLIGKRSVAAVPYLGVAGWGSHWVGPSAAHFGGYDTPEVTSAKIAHAHAQVAQRATLAATAAADPDNHVLLAHHGLSHLALAHYHK